MDANDQDTPQKVKIWNNNVSSAINGRGGANFGFTTPQQKCRNQTTNSQNVHITLTPSSSNVAQESTHMQMMVSTPPAKRFQQRVKNPFEAALAERLHLPLIGSPSLFQRPTTPQLSSTQFEWTIDEVSSLIPTNVEPHETQFHDSPDPEYEAKAQMAISSYFKEQQIVPSPVDCPLRNHRIVLSDLNTNTPISKPGRRIRDFGTQTELTLPFDLPEELEEALKPYLQPHLAGVGTEFKRMGYIPRQPGIDNIKDISLRRKLFDMQNIVILGSDDPLPDENQPPERNDFELSSSPIRMPIAGKLSDSLDKSICNSLSPMSNYHDLSFSPQSPAQSSPTKRKSRLRDFGEELSPILPSCKSGKKSNVSNEQYRYDKIEENISCSDLTNDKLNTSKLDDSLELSSSPIAFSDNNPIGNFSTDSFNVKVSRLAVTSSNSAGLSRGNFSRIRTENLDDLELYMADETNEILEDDEDNMQVSQLSLQSSNCSSSNSDTPQKKRSASRKNLSQSFSASWLQGDDDADDFEMLKFNSASHILTVQSDNTEIQYNSQNAQDENANQKKLHEHQNVNFYRTDSGFNEMTNSQSVMYSQDENSRDIAATNEGDGFQDICMPDCQTK